MSKLKNIVRSRFIKGEDLPDWYEERLSQCSICPLNSVNVEDKSLKTSTWGLIAGKHCTHKDCGCTITQKAKIEEEQCPNNPPRWLSVRMPDRFDKGIENLSPSKVALRFDNLSNVPTFDYGEIAYNSNTDIKFIVKAVEDLKNFKVNPTCGCTVSKVKRVSDGYEVSINYNSRSRGSFNKKINISHFDNNNKPLVLRVAIKGTVLKR